MRERERVEIFVVYEDDRSFVYWSTAADGGRGGVRSQFTVQDAEANRFIGFDLCVANVRSVEEAARDQGMSKEKVVEFMVEKCKLEYEAVFVEELEDESKRPLNYCDVVGPNYHPRGLGSFGSLESFSAMRLKMP